MPRAKEHANAALSLDPDLSEAHATLAYATMLYDRDWSRAEQGFLRAIALDPRSAETRHWYAYFLTAMGRGDEALEQVRLALDLDPVSLPVNAGVGWHLYFAGRYEEAAAQLQRTLELDPDFPLARLELGMTYLQLGRVSAAIEELEVAARRSGGAPIHLAALGGVYAQAGRSDEAREILGRLERLAEERYVPSLYFSGMRLALGDKERALDGLEAAYDERSGYLLYLRRDPVFVSLHSEPRFQALLSRLGVP
jgi:tetratricopeptide (TPR) repeat protein